MNEKGDKAEVRGRDHGASSERPAISPALPEPRKRPGRSRKDVPDVGGSVRPAPGRVSPARVQSGKVRVSVASATCIINGRSFHDEGPDAGKVLRNLAEFIRENSQ